MEPKEASPKIPQTPEREPIIVEEEEEPEEASAETAQKTEDALQILGKTGDASEVEIPKASEAAKDASQEPEVEKADAPLANGDHENADAVVGTEANQTEAAANGAATAAAPVQQLDDEETW